MNFIIWETTQNNMVYNQNKKNFYTSSYFLFSYALFAVFLLINIFCDDKEILQIIKNISTRFVVFNLGLSSICVFNYKSKFDSIKISLTDKILVFNVLFFLSIGYWLYVLVGISPKWNLISNTIFDTATFSTAAFIMNIYLEQNNGFNNGNN